MNDKYLRLLLDNLSRVVLGILAALLAVVYLLVESQKAPLEAEKPKPATPTLDAQMDPSALFRVDQYLAIKPPIEQTKLKALLQFDAFVVQKVETRDDQEKKANARFADAKKAFDQGDIDGALKVADEIRYGIYPPHEKTRELLAKITQLRASQAAAAAAAAAGGAAPAPGATPAPAATAAATPAPAPAATPAGAPAVSFD